jgi:hypothetical protein
MTEKVIHASASPDPAAARFVPGYLLTPFGWAAQLVTAMVAADPALLADVLALDRPRMHVIALALAHLDGPVPPDLGAILFRAPIRRVLDQVLGRSVPGLKAVLRRLPFAVLNRENYQRLVALFDDPEVGRLLRDHTDGETDDSTVEALHEVPASLRSVVAAVLGLIPRLDGLADGLRLLVARGAAPDIDALVADLAAQRQPGQFIGRVKALIAALPLPEILPPAQIGKARRLDQVDEVRRLAKAWRNCLDGYTWQIDSGDCAIYLWDDPGSPAACHVTRAGRLGWLLHKPLGPKNVELPSQQLDLVCSSFAAAGVMQARAARALDRILQSNCDAASGRREARRQQQQERERRDYLLHAAVWGQDRMLAAFGLG